MQAKFPIILALLSLAALAVPGVFAVQLTLNSDNITRVGGTGQVTVLTPENDSTINSVVINYDSNAAPYYVNAVTITWEPAEASDYFIGVTLYDRDAQGNVTIVGSGSATVTLDPTTFTLGQPITTTVPVLSTTGGNIDPSTIDLIEIVIYQLAP